MASLSHFCEGGFCVTRFVFDGVWGRRLPSHNYAYGYICVGLGGIRRYPLRNIDIVMPLARNSLLPNADLAKSRVFRAHRLDQTKWQINYAEGVSAKFV